MTVLLACLVLGEVLGTLQLAGGAVVLAGVLRVLDARLPRRAARRPIVPVLKPSIDGADRTEIAR